MARITGGTRITMDDSTVIGTSLTITGSTTITFTTSAETSFRTGSATKQGPPTITPTAATHGAGVLNGTYEYCYTEGDNSGETTPSPTVSVVASNNTVRVTVGRPRRGILSTYLYRKNPSGLFRRVHVFGGGYFQNVWDDNVADAVVTASTVVPSVDNSGTYGFLAADGQSKYFSSNGSIGDTTQDLALLSGDSSYQSGAYACDSYGPIICRTFKGNSYASTKTEGGDGRHYAAYWQDTIDDGVTPTTVWQILTNGNMSMTPRTLTDAALADGQSTGINLAATLPTIPTVAAIANIVNITSAGSASFTQSAWNITLGAGYTGSSDTFVTRFSNGTATTGVAYGAEGRVTGSAALSVGVYGGSTGGTKKIGVFGSADGAAADSTMTWPSGYTGAGLVGSNGSSSNLPLLALDNITPVFWVTNDGGCVFQSLNAGSGTLTRHDFGIGGGRANYRIEANGSTNIRAGTSNNVPLIFMTNDTNALTISTGQNLTAVGNMKLLSATAIPAGGTAGSGLQFSTATNFGVFFGSGAPSLAAAKGSLYLRSDGSGTVDRIYVNTDASTTWTAIVTVA